MEDHKTRINRRWLNFYHSGCWNLTADIEPGFVAYLLYINWMVNNYNPILILKICEDLTCQHIKLNKKNPMDDKDLRMRMKTIKYYAKK